MRQVLFLCTGNYYRSRFAEILFNELAQTAGLGWRAISRGLAPNPASRNVGPISAHAINGLVARGVPLHRSPRNPREVSVDELRSADLVIAVKEAEHRRFLTERFSGWEDRVEYWHIHDIDAAHPDTALVELEQRIRALVARLGTEAN